MHFKIIYGTVTYLSKFSLLATTPENPSFECEPFEKCNKDNNTFKSGLIVRNLTTSCKI